MTAKKTQPRRQKRRANLNGKLRAEFGNGSNWFRYLAPVIVLIVGYFIYGQSDLRAMGEKNEERSLQNREEIASVAQRLSGELKAATAELKQTQILHRNELMQETYILRAEISDTRRELMDAIREK